MDGEDITILKNKLKFLMLSTFYPPYHFGGEAIYIYHLSNELAKRGHKVDIVHCIDSYNLLEQKGPKGEYPHHENITVYPFKSGFGPISPLLTQQTSYSFFKRKKIKSLIYENDYDVIHYHNMSLIGLETLSFGNAIKLYTMHEHWLVCPMHILWKYNREVCNKRNCIYCQIRGKRPIQWWRYSKIIEAKLQHLDVLISPSLFTKHKHHELGLNLPITCLPHFIPKAFSQLHRSNETNFAHKKPYFLFVGRLEKIKGLQNLIPVFYKYQKCDLLVAGDGNYDSTLKNLAKNIPNIEFLGRLSYDNLKALYRNALATIVPSICYEVFPIIIIESFAHKTPVIANNLGALPEVVQQNGGGFIYSTDEQLIERLENLRLNLKLRDELGNKGYQFYQKYWTEEYHINRYYQLIKEVAEKKEINNLASTHFEIKDNL